MSAPITAVIGLTGGIACGKSSVAAVYATVFGLGAAAYRAIQASR